MTRRRGGTQLPLFKDWSGLLTIGTAAVERTPYGRGSRKTPTAVFGICTGFPSCGRVRSNPPTNALGGAPPFRAGCGRTPGAREVRRYGSQADGHDALQAGAAQRRLRQIFTAARRERHPASEGRQQERAWYQPLRGGQPWSHRALPPPVFSPGGGFYPSEMSVTTHH
ncbi:hypothetical protein LX32DRAFT_378456 [Colletotrichum zoysiae]|uniref:Uncharacterized protein n=1 Tax=Colletotrichum zoysiae TaxID=1216348 RepID=A0AAD9M191_9PEZI|nr:hypothetical protein LX32DRAFT_378456 [Colletotrichum zoysiae]